MESKLLKVLGLAAGVCIAADLAFQICMQLGGEARAVACVIGLALMAALPLAALRLVFGAGAWAGRAQWRTLAALLLCFGAAYAVAATEGTLDGSQAAALVLLPGIAAFFLAVREAAGGRL